MRGRIAVWCVLCVVAAVASDPHSLLKSYIDLARVKSRESRPQEALRFEKLANALAKEHSMKLPFSEILKSKPVEMPDSLHAGLGYVIAPRLVAAVKSAPQNLEAGLGYKKAASGGDVFAPKAPELPTLSAKHSPALCKLAKNKHRAPCCFKSIPACSQMAKLMRFKLISECHARTMKLLENSMEQGCASQCSGGTKKGLTKMLKKCNSSYKPSTEM